MTAQRAVLRIPSNGAVGLAVKRCYPDLFIVITYAESLLQFSHTSTKNCWLENLKDLQLCFLAFPRPTGSRWKHV